jgi:hypothetical protein
MEHALWNDFRNDLRVIRGSGRTRREIRSRSKDVERPPRPDQILAEKSLLSAPSRALLTPAEMLVVERKRVPYFAAGSGGMQQT